MPSSQFENRTGPYRDNGGSIYRIYDADGELLYVGLTVKAPVRLHEHALAKPWWKDVAVIALTHYASDTELEEAERLAIETECPRWNVRHNEKVKDAETRTDV